MRIARTYDLHARPDAAADLYAALVGLICAIEAIEGCLSVTLLRDDADPHRFMVLECWLSNDAYGAGEKAIPRDALKSVMTALATPPSTARWSISDHH